MRRCTWAAPWILAGLAAIFSATPARGGLVRVGMGIGRVQQLGPAYPGHPVAFEVQARNVGTTECGVCSVRVFGGGVAASRVLPRIPPGEMVKVTVEGLLFQKPGKYMLSFIIEGPRDAVEFEAPRPHAIFELTVLEGSPVRKGAPR